MAAEYGEPHAMSKKQELTPISALHVAQGILLRLAEEVHVTRDSPKSNSRPRPLHALGRRVARGEFLQRTGSGKDRERLLLAWLRVLGDLQAAAGKPYLACRLAVDKYAHGFAAS